MELRFFGNTQPMSKEWEIENVEVIPVDNPELYRMEPPASTRWGQIATSTLPKNASGQRWKTLKHLKPKSLKNRGVLDHHFLEEIPREMLHVYKQTLKKKTGSSQSKVTCPGLNCGHQLRVICTAPIPDVCLPRTPRSQGDDRFKMLQLTMA